MLREIKTLIYKDILLELRSVYSFAGLVLYLGASTFMCFMLLKNPSLAVTNVFYWLLILFATLNAISKAFIGTPRGSLYYLYTTASAKTIIIAKLIFNSLLLIFITLLAVVLFALLLNAEFLTWEFTLTAVVACICFSSAFTMLSMIAAQADNSLTLMAVMAFPLILPVILVLVKVSNKLVMGGTLSHISNDLLTLGGLVIVFITASYILFPYIWRD